MERKTKDQLIAELNAEKAVTKTLRESAIKQSASNVKLIEENKTLKKDLANMHRSYDEMKADRDKQLITIRNMQEMLDDFRDKYEGKKENLAPGRERPFEVVLVDTDRMSPKPIISGELSIEKIESGYIVKGEGCTAQDRTIVGRFSHSTDSLDGLLELPKRHIDTAAGGKSFTVVVEVFED